jgi:predicted phage baseplate assembly protein
MSRLPPKIDARDKDALLSDLLALARFYTPEWRIKETGPGRAFVEAFLLFQREVIARLNRVPDKLFLAFMDQLGVSLLPAKPARAPVIFTPPEGSTKSVVVPAGTEVAAGEVVFQTEGAFSAASAALKAVFSIVPHADAIVDHVGDLASPDTAVLFTTDPMRNLQEHSLYIGDPDLFNLKTEATILLPITGNRVDLLRTPSFQWEWWSKEGRWEPLTVLVSTAGNVITLAKTTVGEIDKLKIGGIESRWIRCRIKGKLLKGSPTTNLTVDQIGVAPATTGLDPDLSFYNDIPLALPPSEEKPLLPFGTRPRQADTFYIASQEAFSKSSSEITLSTIGYPAASGGLPIERVNGIGKNFKERLLAAEIRTTADLVRRPTAEVAEILRNREKNLPVSRYLTRARNLQEAAAKQYFDKVVTTGNVPTVDTTTLSVPVLSWEYWNGQGWMVIGGLVDSSISLLAPGTVTFKVPADMTATKVGGQENLWIRVRVAFGDYGQEKFVFDQNTWQTDTADIHPPQLFSLTLQYNVTPRIPASIVTLNNLQYTVPPTGSFSPFVALKDDHQAFYLGLEKTLIDGPYTLLVVLEEQDYAEDDRPQVVWEYSRTDAIQPWARLLPDDGTNQLVRTGVVMFAGPSDAATMPLFGQTLFWIRAVDVADRFGTGQSGSIQAISPQMSGGLQPCAESVSVFASLFPGATKGQIPAPRITGIHPNAMWVVQRQSILDEVFGSSDGTPGQSFRLARVPIVRASIWVNEFGSLTEEEILAFKTDATQIEEQTDLTGARVAFWVRWTSIADLAPAGPADRKYVLDPVQGIVLFGDGVHGKIPPIAGENLSADYEVGGGSAGNIPAGKIAELRSGIAGIESVINPLPAEGGADTEKVTELINRGPHFLKHRNQAIMAEDYESLATESSREVARVRCLPNTDDQGQRALGWVTVMIVPESTDARPVPRPSLKENVKAYLAERAPGVVSELNHLFVTGPIYLQISVTVDLYPVSLSVAATAEKNAVEQLSAFLHPLTGGLDGQGWQFGQVPCLSDILALLHGIEGVDHLENLKLKVEEPESGTVIVVDTEETMFVPSPFTLVSSGEHDIRLKRKGE